MKRKLTAIILSSVLALSMLSGCVASDGGKGDIGGGADPTSAKGGAKGRYVETEIMLPGEGLFPYNIFENEDGSVDYYAAKGEMRDEFVAYNSKNLKTWEDKKLPWHEEIKASETGLKVVNSINRAKDGSLFVSITDKDDLKRVYKVAADGGTAAEIAMPSWDEENKDESFNFGGVTVEGSGGASADVSADGEIASPKKMTKRQTVGVSQITPLDNGDFLIRYSGGETIRHDGKTGAELKSYEQGYFNNAVLGSKLYKINNEVTQINVIDLDSGNTDKSIPVTKNSGNYNVYSDNTDAIYLAGLSGISRMVSGGSVLETIIDGGRSVLSIPSNDLRILSVGKDNSFYMIFSGVGNSVKLFHAVFDKDMPSVPDTELTVYSLYENSTMRQAIGEFQQANPSIMINFRIGMDSESSATLSDVIRALNVEIVANKAPDIIILDGLPADSYIEKGVFADLTELYNEINSANKLIEPVASSFKKDGKVYAIPARFKMPLMLGSPELLSGLNSFADMKAVKDAENPLLETGEIRDFLSSLIPSSYGAWIKPDGSLDEARLSEFFTDINDIYGKYKPKGDPNAVSMMTTSAFSGGGGEAFTFTGADMAYMQNTVQTTISNVGSMGYLSMIGRDMQFYSAVGDGIGVAEPKEPKSNKGGIRFIPGQTEGAYTPAVIAGITNSSKQQDAAKSFLKTIFSEKVQTLSFGDGFAVNEAAYKASAIRRTMNEDGTEQTETITNVIELLGKLKTPIIPDSVVLEAVTNSATSLLKGETDVTAAVKDVLKNVEIYLTE